MIDPALSLMQASQM